MTVALAGNPNVGKSTLFNAMTGLRQHTGNWPGKTVGIAEGQFRRKDTVVRMVDLPGTYSLSGVSEDERIAGEFLRSNQADCVVVVCDATALERTLILAIQILQLTQSVILCVNLADEAKSRGITVDGDRLSQMLGVPVVMTAAGKKAGISELQEKLFTLGDLRFSPKCWSDPIRQAKEITQQCVHHQPSGEDWRMLLDRILVSRRRGIPILLALLFLLVFITVWGANYPSMLLQQCFDWGYVGLKEIMKGLPLWCGGLLLDGVYATTARVMSVMLPPMAIYFPLFTILEDVGYLPRMAFLLDGAMEKCGGSGRQALTMCMGLGCNAVGVTGCRIMDSPQERLAAILTNAMIPCNGRFPTLIVLAAMFSQPGVVGFVVAGFVAAGILGAMMTTGVLHKTALRHGKVPFVMELSPFRRPQLGQIVIRSLLDRTMKVALRAVIVAAPAGAVLWLLQRFALLGTLAGWLDGIGLFLGMNGVIFLSFLLSIPANELLVPIIVLTAGTAVMETFSIQTILCTMIFTVFHWPCATTLLTIRKETGSIAKTAAAFLLPTAVGILLCMFVNLLL